MTNIEINDVLSSIRRLVSEEKPKKPANAPAKDRFVLTPALRVMDDPASTAPGSDGLSARATPDPAAPLELKQYLATPVPADQTPPAPDTTAVSPEFLAMEQGWKSELAQVSSRGPAPRSTPAAAEPMSLETRIAELEAAVSMAGEEWEPDGSEPDFGKPPRHHIFEVVDNATQPDKAGQPGEDTQADTDTHAPDPVRHAETTAEMPFFSHTAAPPPEVYETEHGPVSPIPTLPRQSPTTAPDPTAGSVVVPDVDVAPVLAPDHDPIPFPAPGDVVEDDDVFLDVEALREMISDVVRAELHGKMGETITSNVRRMVQQEIARALTHRDPDAD